MTNQQINDGIKLICETSKTIQNCYESKQALATEINNAKTEDIEKCWEYYKDRSGVIVDVRKDLFRLLMDRVTITEKTLDDLVAKHKKGKENQFRVYKKFYSIFYPAITFYGHNPQREFIKAFEKKLIEDLGLNNEVKTTSVDFQGARQQGSDRYWLAIYNKEQPNQSKGLQFFIDFHHGKMSYGIYRHGNRDYVKANKLVTPETFDYNQMLEYFREDIALLIDDKPKVEFSNSENPADKKSKNLSITMSLNQILYGPPGTGKTYELNSFLKKITNTGSPNSKTNPVTLNQHKNFWHLAPGEGGYLWDELKNGNRLGYEWCGNNIGDLKTLDRDITENYNIRNYFSYVKKGDFFCIISGKKFYAIAEALHDYDFSKALDDNYDFQTIEVRWIRVFDVPELLNASYTPTFGKLNGGKRWDSLINALNSHNIFLANQKNPEAAVVEKQSNFLFTTFHQSYSYEDFVEGIKPSLDEKNNVIYSIEDGIFKIACDKAANLAGFEDLSDALRSPQEIVKSRFNQSEKFYLFIDEINRGNVSSIFGELITLIEDDKRLGNENETRIILPYSKSAEGFCVPPNLYIIGTMNTADRSVEALDTALRRRFSFQEMLPRPELIRPSAMYCRLLWEYKKVDWEVKKYKEKEDVLFDLIGAPNEINDKKRDIWDQMVKDKTHNDYSYFDSFVFTGIDLSKLLNKINQRIECLLDRDHTIGHSYFMSVISMEDLKDTFKNKIIPLLQEYFYNDYSKIGLVLGNGFVRVKESSIQKEGTLIFANFPTRDQIDIETSYELIPINEVKFEDAINQLLA